MHELGLDLPTFGDMFSEVGDAPVAVIEIDAAAASTLAELLAVPVRRCYISDDALRGRVAATSAPTGDIIAAKLPSEGSTMAGDFGEILTSLFQAAREHPLTLVDPIKWRLKQDRTKPAPMSDVVQMILPRWPDASHNDRLICSEVKTKSTGGNSKPIEEAIEDSQKDSAGRLVKTLVWLRERSLDTGLETVTLEQLERFIHAIDYPPAKREFGAVAVIAADLVEAELVGANPPPVNERTLLVISVPNLKENYQSVYRAAHASAKDSREFE